MVQEQDRPATIAEAARDIPIEVITLTEGIQIETRLRLGSALAIEARFNKPFNAIDWTRLCNTLVVLYYLAKQVTPNLKEDAFNEKVLQLDLTTISEKVLGALTGHLKNFQEPGQELPPELTTTTDMNS
jgi:hypothetical protein